MSDPGTRRLSPRARLGSVAVACLLAAGIPHASADTRSRLGQAKSRLAELESRLQAAAREVARRQHGLRSVLRSLSVVEAGYQDVEIELMNLRARRVAAVDQYEEVRQTIDQRAAEAYMQGPMGGLEGILSATSLGDLDDRVQFVSAIAEHDAELAAAAEERRARVQQQVVQESRALVRRAAVVRRLDHRRELVDAAFVADQRALREMSATREAILTLVDKLRNKLTSQEVAAATMGAGKGMPIGYGRWAAKFLPAIHAPVTHNNLVVMVAWQSAEGTTATWNPLATTYSMPGATEFNSVGVRNYASLRDGIHAVVGTLKNPGHGYEAIVADLKASFDPMVTAEAINASDWCHGCAGGQYVTELIPAVEQYFASYSSR